MHQVWTNTIAHIYCLFLITDVCYGVDVQADTLTLSQTMFKELKWLDFPKRVQYHSCILIYKALNGMAPEYIQNLFSKSSEIHNRNLRSVENEFRTPEHATMNGHLL